MSAFCTVSTMYSFTFSLFHFCIEIRNVSMSLSVTESRELSKNRIVKIRNAVITTQRNITAKAGLIESTTPAKSSQISDPIPKVILFRESIVPYSLGSA